ncbi:heme exporter protein CcmD [Burkholderiaceae bacterium FT117]|uniref:heme exporter protein CcmD n=1 Tax=Zeimonas sediminis TaxID=2944268 RepID=UPI002342C28B|nr:heme exporter protein CcmD [Zeimonas sediminis]MCM5569893.1 heme exporter protein CcmD [Zeimonas sediminis]
MSEWLAMGGHGFYIWSSYAMLALCVAIELWALRRRRKAAWQQVDETREEMESARPARATDTE